MILTVGDSFTVKRYEGDKPWPEVLSNLNGEVVYNWAREGASNTCIFRKFVHGYSEYSKSLDTVIVGLSNWDRLPVSYINYRSESDGDNYCIIRRPGTKGWEEWPDSGHYSPMYHLEQTLTYVYSMIQMCEAAGIKIYFIQPIMPFHDNSRPWIERWEDKNGLKLHHQIELSRLWNIIAKEHSDKFLGVNLGARNLGKRARDPNDMWLWFCGKAYHPSGRPEYQMGFHNKMLYSGSIQNDPDVYDNHPNLKGHKAIAEYIYEHINT